ncbi:hypothetical protein [Chromatium okenii]|uniref:hypothetical protein n=1 Tax=Chromatium okenii TaxID=61644 RepID=UPI0024133749|nr:hypothetical protein [Chromatium okenii]
MISTSWRRSDRFCHRDAPLRVLRLQLTNTGDVPRQLSAFSYQRLVMGNQPQTDSAIVTAHDAERDVLTAVNPQAGDFAAELCLRQRGCLVRKLRRERTAATGSVLSGVTAI